MTIRNLDAVFRPRSVALIGASERAGSIGRVLLDNLAKFPGEVFPVNSAPRAAARAPCLCKRRRVAGGSGSRRDRHAGAERSRAGRRVGRTRRARGSDHLGRPRRPHGSGPRAARGARRAARAPVARRRAQYARDCGARFGAERELRAPDAGQRRHRVRHSIGRDCRRRCSTGRRRAESAIRISSRSAT